MYAALEVFLFGRDSASVSMVSATSRMHMADCRGMNTCGEMSASIEVSYGRMVRMAVCFTQLLWVMKKPNSSSQRSHVCATPADLQGHRADADA